jgi:uncharacterized protein (TIGR02147 family)
MKKPDLFTYLDFRAFLKDAFQTRQDQEPKFSYRAFGKQAGYSSPNLLQLILSGRRDLSTAHLPGTIRALGLNKQEADFFANLVGFNQAADLEEKNFHYQRMIRSRKYAEVKPVEKGQFEYFDQWYHPVVRELLVHGEFDGTMAWLAAHVSPPITVAQAEKSVELLESLGLIRLDSSSNRWQHVDAAISTPSEVTSLAIANYHRAVLRLASDSIESFDPKDRDLRAVTLGIPKSAFPELKRRMEAFWRDLVALGDGGQGVEEVVQINLQLFPMSKPTGPENPGGTHA